ncbi:restriction endonuclease subunit S [Nocardioides sp. TRM66260-LWL]|uniref:restriction endonuclease subunit S n=1 Tax=Nocardioides sp. TRM66260-LWL TaxID=2874478 RepID=UPI001CC70749|nr:restriction endonuclease subunit S [Nocardioides sp. TRM66260-LWL]MBZ5733588.1 restriction endonuclease subunit S [Nocardioides sp. TRM66260-LWL]
MSVVVADAVAERVHKWLGDIPAGWTGARLFEVADAWTSNVDKHSVEGQPSVRLCNYVDVYKNDSIVDSLDFMAATATREQIRKFRIRVGDTLITKDSETADDIGVPAFVEYEADDLICGYHLAIIRPHTKKVVPKFLYWTLDSEPIARQWGVTAAGVTRVGIRSTDLNKVTIPLPSPDEQRAIADFLDHETAQIDALVAKQEELIRHLEERRLAVITTTTLTGLRGEESGEHDVTRWGSSLAVEPWLVRAPHTWGMERFKTVCLPREERNVAGTELMLSLTVKGHLIDRSTMAVQQNASDASIPRYFVARPNDLVVNPMWLIGGAIGVSDKRGAVSPDYRVFEIADVLDPWYLNAVLRSAPYFDQYRLYTRSNTTFDRRIKQNDLDNLPIPIPPMDEQRVIVAHINEQTTQIDALISKTQEHIALARERRSALITAAVTGQIDVRTARKAS